MCVCVCAAVVFVFVIVVRVVDVKLFEGGGGALPEYASREGCGVEVPDSGNAASRKKSRSRLRVA